MTNKWRNLSAALLSGAALVAIGGLPGGGDRSAEKIAATTVAATSDVRVPQAKTTPLAPRAGPPVNVVAEQWVAAIQSDVFGDTSIFSELASQEAFTNILKKGIVSFERKTLRSPNYKDEDGYDLVVYEVQHPLSQVSRVLAYEEGDEDHRSIEVLVLSGQPGESTAELVQFDGKTVASQRQVTWMEAQKLFDQELSQASTLMSASIK